MSESPGRMKELLATAVFVCALLHPIIAFLLVNLLARVLWPNSAAMRGPAAVSLSIWIDHQHGLLHFPRPTTIIRCLLILALSVIALFFVAASFIEWKTNHATLVPITTFNYVVGIATTFKATAFLQMLT